MSAHARIHVAKAALDDLANGVTKLGNPAPFGAADRGSPTIAVLSIAKDDNADIGAAEVTAGSWPVKDRPNAEVLLFLAGDLEVAPEGESPYQLTPGDLVVLAKGWSGRFTTAKYARFVFSHPAR